MAGKKDKIRQQARDYFVENFDVTKKEVAELFQVTEKTIGDWSQREDWENERLNFHTSPVRIKQLVQTEILSIAQGNPPKLPADSMSKLMAVFEKVNKTADATVVAAILKALDNFISEDNPELAHKCLPYHKQFLIHRINLEA